MYATLSFLSSVLLFLKFWSRITWKKQHATASFNPSTKNHHKLKKRQMTEWFAS